MNKQECKKIMAFIATTFPKYYKDFGKDLFEKQVSVWTDLLGEYDANEVYSGVRAYITAEASAFPPTPGQVVEYMHRLRHLTDTSGAEAWAIVRKAVRHSGYNAKSAFEALPPLVKRAVGDAESLRAMAMMDIDKMETVAQSNFLRTYEAIKRREAIEERYPQPIRNQIAKLKEEKEQIEQKPQNIPKPEKPRETTVAPADRLKALRERLK